MTDGMEVVLVEQTSAPLTVFGTDNPAAIMQRVTDISKPLADFIRQQHMAVTISDREYVLAEGWAFMGAMLGVSPRTVRVTELRDADGLVCGFEANVELMMRDGSIVGGAIAECARTEKQWSSRDDFALKSMSQTRAACKAYRMALGFVMKAAGYEATPADEMTAEERPAANAGQPRPPQARPQASAPKAGWSESLKAAMTEHDITFDDIGQYFGERPTTARIQRWLDDNPAGNVRTLVEEVEALRIIAAAEVVDGEVVEA